MRRIARLLASQCSPHAPLVTRIADPEFTFISSGRQTLYNAMDLRPGFHLASRCRRYFFTVRQRRNPIPDLLFSDYAINGVVIVDRSCPSIHMQLPVFIVVMWKCQFFERIAHRIILITLLVHEILRSFTAEKGCGT